MAAPTEPKKPETAESKGATRGGPGVARSARQAPLPVEIYRSSIGKKLVMAVTGVILLGYVVTHMLANLRIYWNPEGLDDYAAWLRVLGAPATPTESTLLWVFRVGLLVAFLLHIHAAYALTRMNRRARTEGYTQKRDWVAADFASRTMRWTGVIVLLFVIYHVLHLTTGNVHPDFQEHEVAHNVIAGFQSWPVVIFYVLANLALGLHLYHGGYSLFRSLGGSNPRFESARRGFGVILAVTVTVGNVSMPLAIVTGIID